MSTLIADSGSTKTDWMLIAGNGAVSRYETMGMNPVVYDEASIANTIGKSFAPKVKDIVVDKIFFYGAGCTSERKGVVERALAESFPDSEIEVDTDVLAAARALCGHKEGIACILGTGSNSCLYNGRDIVANVSPLGFILGDEGSGAVLGRNFVSDILKGQMPDDITKSFFVETKLSEAEIVDRVYRKPMPNRFLASLVPFIHSYHRDSQIASMLVANFRRFIQRNVLPYNRPDLPVNFIGGVAHSFIDEITVAVHIEHLTMGRVDISPANGLLTYHTTMASEDII